MIISKLKFGIKRHDPTNLSHTFGGNRNTGY